MRLSASLNKSALRAHYRAARLAVPPKDRVLFAEAAAHYLRESAVFQQAQTVACYFATSTEFETANIVESIIRAGKQCYLPVLTAEKTLVFVAYTPGDVLVPNQYHIPEPLIQPHQTISPASLDLVLLPLVAFDAQGHRLGAGGGYYDRTFAFMREQSQKPYLMGVGYQAQATATLPVEPYDVTLHGVLTEKGVLHFT